MTTEKATPPGIALDNEALDRLEALARAATPGPWAYATDWDRAAVYSTTHKVPRFGGEPIHKRVVCSGNQNNDGRFGKEHWSGADWNDAEFIAAANPATILTLIAQARAAQPQPSAAPDERAALRDLVALWDSNSTSSDDYNEEMRAIEDRMRALAAAPSPNFAARGAEPAGMQAALLAFDDRYCGYEFPSDALRAGALDEFIAGWKAAQATQLSAARRGQPTAATTPQAQPAGASPCITDEQIMRIAGDVKQRNAGAWPGDVAFARAVLQAAAPAPHEQKARAAVLDGLPDNYTVNDSELARRIMVFLGRATTASMEPGADPLRDRLAEKLAEWTRAPAAQAGMLPVAQTDAARDVLEDLMAEHRIAVTPEYEGGFHAQIYRNREEPVANDYGTTPRAAVDAALEGETMRDQSKGGGDA